MFLIFSSFAAAPYEYCQDLYSAIKARAVKADMPCALMDNIDEIGLLLLKKLTVSCYKSSWSAAALLPNIVGERNVDQTRSLCGCFVDPINDFICLHSDNSSASVRESCLKGHSVVRETIYVIQYLHYSSGGSGFPLPHSNSFGPFLCAVSVDVPLAPWG